MGGIINAISDLIFATFILILAYITAIVVFVYSGYFVGMVVALAAGFILGVSTAIIPVIFAWAFIGIATILFIRSEEHTSELQSRGHLVCRLLLEKKKDKINSTDVW